MDPAVGSARGAFRRNWHSNVCGSMTDSTIEHAQIGPSDWVNLLIAKAVGPLPSGTTLPNGTLDLLIATTITDDEMAWSKTNGRGALLNLLVAGGVAQFSERNRASVSGILDVRRWTRRRRPGSCGRRFAGAGRATCGNGATRKDPSFPAGSGWRRRFPQHGLCAKRNAREESCDRRDCARTTRGWHGVAVFGITGVRRPKLRAREDQDQGVGIQSRTCLRDDVGYLVRATVSLDR